MSVSALRVASSTGATHEGRGKRHFRLPSGGGNARIAGKVAIAGNFRRYTPLPRHRCPAIFMRGTLRGRRRPMWRGDLVDQQGEVRRMKVAFRTLLSLAVVLAVVMVVNGEDEEEKKESKSKT